MPTLIGIVPYAAINFSTYEYLKTSLQSYPNPYIFSLTLNPKPYTPHPLISTFNPQPSTLNPQPSTLNPQPSTLNPKPSTLNPQPPPLNHQPSTLNLLPSTHNPQPSMINPQPSTLNPEPGHTQSSARQTATLSCGRGSGRLQTGPIVIFLIQFTSWRSLYWP